MFSLLLRPACAVLALLVLAPIEPAGAASYKVTAPLKGMNRPDLPCCTPIYLLGPPVISGDYVVFTSRNGPADGIWSWRISKGKLKKLAGFETKAPGGSGNFTAFGANGSEFPTTIGGGTAVFYARDAKNAIGLYSVSVNGGTITRIASTKTAAPELGEKFNDIRGASTNGKTVAFWGNVPEGVAGIYQAGIDGKDLTKVINDLEPLDARSPNGPVEDYFGIFSQPKVGKAYVQFYTNGLFDPVSGPNAIFRAKGGFTDIADNMTTLQGGGDEEHVRIGLFSASTGSGAVAFAADEPNTGYAGLFKVKNMDSALMFVSTDTTVPGKSVPFATFLGFGYDESGLAFTATYVEDEQAVQSVYVIDKPGGTPVRVANGDKYYLPAVGDRSISGGRIVFWETSNGADTFYLATPKD